MAGRLDLALALPRRLASAAQLPLDPFASQLYAAYGLRRLISAYGGAGLRVRRSADGAEMDIGFIGAALDAAALLAFVGAGSGYVATWYDQTGNAHHATQTTAAAQPRIVNAGILDLGPEGRPVFIFDGTDDWLSLAASQGVARAAGALTFAAVAAISTTATSYLFLSTDEVGNYRASIYSAGGTVIAGYGRRVDSDPFASFTRVRGTGWQRYATRYRFAEAAYDAVVNGGVTTLTSGTAGLTADTDSNAAARLGSAAGATFYQGSVAAFVIARVALDIPTLDAALAQVMP